MSNIASCVSHTRKNIYLLSTKEWYVYLLMCKSMTSDREKRVQTTEVLHTETQYLITIGQLTSVISSAVLLILDHIFEISYFALFKRPSSLKGNQFLQARCQDRSTSLREISQVTNSVNLASLRRHYRIKLFLSPYSGRCFIPDKYIIA